MTRPKIALYWCASCGGCEESVVDLAEDILSVVETADIVFWPVGLDFKYSDVEALEDGELEATLINGAIRTSEQEAMARLLREKSRLIVAHGSCAHLGGVVGLANLYSRDSLLRRACVEVPSMVNPGEVLPQETWGAEHFTLELPAFCENGEDAGTDRGGGLLHPGMSSHARPREECIGCDSVGEPSRQGIGSGGAKGPL